MPYPMEHALRVESPSYFSRFRRKNNIFGKGVHAIFGTLKSEYEGGPRGGRTAVQAIRFDANKFTLTEAKKWARQHDYSGSWSKASGVYANPMYKSGDILYNEAEHRVMEMLKHAGLYESTHPDVVRLMIRTYYQGWLDAEQFHEIKPF